MPQQTTLKPPFATEPTIEEMINDPIVKLLMKRDGVKQEVLVPLFHNIFFETYEPQAE